MTEKIKKGAKRLPHQLEIPIIRGRHALERPEPRTRPEDDEENGVEGRRE
jgi:hypothetical protein